MSESDRQQIQDYMAKHGINELLYQVLEKLCLDKPENPHQFIVDYLYEARGCPARTCRASAIDRIWTPVLAQHFPEKLKKVAGASEPDREAEAPGEEAAGGEDNGAKGTGDDEAAAEALAKGEEASAPQMDEVGIEAAMEPEEAGGKEVSAEVIVAEGEGAAMTSAEAEGARSASSSRAQTTSVDDKGPPAGQ